MTDNKSGINQSINQLYSGHDKLPTPLPSDATLQPDGENPLTLKVIQKNIKTNEIKNPEKKDNTI
jgi:hypothetical protein